MKNIIYLWLLFSILCTSCEKSLFDAGETISKEFPIAQDLWIIEVENMFEIQLIQDTINKAIVTCGANLMPDMQITSLEHTLYLNHSVNYSWSREYEKIKLTLYLKNLPRLNIYKPVYIATKDTFTTDNFVFVVWNQFAEINACINTNYIAMYLSLEDFGKYTLKGKCKNAEINPNGSGFMDCRDLVTENCRIWQKSIANTYINVTKQLTVEFKEKGNIYYTGNPDTIIYVNQPVSGKLINWNP